MGDSVNLTHHFLIAMPAMVDPHFANSLTYVCEHNPDGALGIVVNKPLPMRLQDVLEQMNLEAHTATIAEKAVLRGGPVSTDRGFVLHRPGGKWERSHRVSDMIQVTTSRDVLGAMARGEGPEDAFIALGYAGWEAGQLEREIKDNSWMSMPLDARMVFDLPYEERWSAAWRFLGIDKDMMSRTSGHA